MNLFISSFDNRPPWQWGKKMVYRTSSKGGKKFQRTEKRQKTDAVRPPLEHLNDECKIDNAPSSRLCVPVLSKLCFAKARAPSSI